MPASNAGIAPDFSAFEAALLNRIAGERRAVGANNPFLATTADRVWLILRGRLDVAVVPMRDGKVVGVGRHLLSLDHGQVLFGMPPIPMGEDGLTLGLRVVAAMDSELFEAPRADLERAEFDLIAVDWIDEWVERLTVALGAGRPMPDHAPIEADPDQPMTRALTAPHGAVRQRAWPSGVRRGHATDRRKRPTRRIDREAQPLGVGRMLYLPTQHPRLGPDSARRRIDHPHRRQAREIDDDA